MNISHTIGQHDPNIGTWDKNSILLHIDDNFILRLDNYDELVEVIDQLNYIRDYIFLHNPELSH
jgi:hypothetical protein